MLEDTECAIEVCHNNMLYYEILQCVHKHLLNEQFKMTPKKKKSNRLRSGECRAQAIAPACQIYLPGYIAPRWLCTSCEKCTGAPSCMKHMPHCTVTVAGIFCYRKTCYSVPFKHSDRRYCLKR